MKILDFLKKAYIVIISPSLYVVLFAILGTLCVVTGVNILLGKASALIICGLFFLFFMAVIARGMRSG